MLNVFSARDVNSVADGVFSKNSSPPETATTRAAVPAGNTLLRSAVAFHLHTHSHVPAAAQIYRKLQLQLQPQHSLSCPHSEKLLEDLTIGKNRPRSAGLKLSTWSSRRQKSDDRLIFDVPLPRRGGVICKSFHCPTVIKSCCYLYCRRTCSESAQTGSCFNNFSV